MKINKTIDIVNSISPKEFERKYYQPQKPLIIKDFTKNCAAGKKWTIEYLKSACGDVVVDIFDNTIKKQGSSAFTKADLKMKFREYIDIIIRDEPSNLRIFLFNMFKRKSELRKDFPCPKIFKGVLGKIGYMFFGSKNIKVRIHQDIDMSGVLLTQFHGRKKVILIKPEYSALLYRLPFSTYSLVDLDNPDYHKYPGLAYVEAEECILEEGDALFMPSGYWHYITYIEGGFGISYRRLAPALTMKLHGLFCLVVYMPLDKLANLIASDKWLAKKEKMAQIRADRMIAQITNERRRKQLENQEQFYRSELRIPDF